MQQFTFMLQKKRIKWVTNKLKTCLFFSETLYLKNNRVITRQYFIYKYITGRKKIAVVMTDLHLETLFWYLTFFFLSKKAGGFHWFDIRHLYVKMIFDLQKKDQGWNEKYFFLSQRFLFCFWRKSPAGQMKTHHSSPKSHSLIRVIQFKGW